MMSRKDPITITHPELLEGWDYEKNNIGPENYTKGSGTRIHWICDKGHEWEDSINHRTSGRGCSVCAGKKIIVGNNDLKTLYPELVKEWNWEKNISSPTDYLSKSNKKVWWKCKIGHEWRANISNRTHCKKSCPYCAGKKVLEGYNDLAMTHPHLLKEWNWEKNDFQPTSITAGSGKKVWWGCENNHEWITSVKNRALKGRGCSKCKRSAGEKALFDFIVKITDAQVYSNDRVLISPYEIDILILDLRLAFEYNGTYWHSDKRIFERKGMSAGEYHQMKTNRCKEKGVTLYHISEKDWIDNNAVTKERVEEIIASQLDSRKSLW